MRYFFITCLILACNAAAPYSFGQNEDTDTAADESLPAEGSEGLPSQEDEYEDKGEAESDIGIENEDMRKQYNDAFGQEDAEPTELPPYVPGNSREARELSHVGIFYTYTPYAILVAGRHGVELDWIINENWSLTGEYGKASYSASRYSIDLASFSETIYGVHARYYPGNSFNLQFGLGRRKHELKLGDDLIRSGSRKISVESSVLHFAFGNRWQWANGFSVGADWLVFDIPVGPSKVDDRDLTDKVKDEDDRDEVKDILSAMRYFPSIGVLRVGLGYVF